MAVGDVVNGIFTSAGVYHYFQPAAGVEVIITSTHGSNSQTLLVGLYNGTTSSTSALVYQANWTSTPANTKIAINNTNHLSIYTNGNPPPSYSGIQIK